MTELPDELEGFADDLAERVSAEVSDTVADDILDGLIEDLPPELVQELHEGQLEPLTPEQGLQRFKQEKRKDVCDEVFRRYETKLEYLEEYLTRVLGLQNLNDLTPRQADEYETWREHDSLDRETPLARTTLEDDIYLYIEFLEYMAKLRAIPSDAYDIVEPVELKDGEGVDRETLDPDRAGDILVYLDRFEYASLEHVTWVLFTKTGRRPIDIRALDLDDFDYDGDTGTLQFKHRPETGTGLKENEDHEAVITLAGSSGKVVQDFIAHNRPDVVDEFRREPLLATKNGRISKSTVKKYAYKWSRPCEIGQGCPYDRDIETCEAADVARKASKCPGSRSPRKIRSGYITAKLNAGSSYEAVGYRVGATKAVLKRHYDHPTESEEQDRYEEDVLTNNEKAAGYANRSDEDGKDEGTA